MIGAINVEWLGKKTINMVKGKTRVDWQPHSALMLILMIPFSRLYPPCHYTLQYDYSKELIFTLHYLEYTERLWMQMKRNFPSEYMWGGACFILSTLHLAYGNYQDGFALSHTYCHGCTVFLCWMGGALCWNKHNVYFKGRPSGGEGHTAGLTRPLCSHACNFSFSFYCLK